MLSWGTEADFDGSPRAPSALVTSRRAVLFGLGVWAFDRSFGTGPDGAPNRVTTTGSESGAPLDKAAGLGAVEPFLGDHRFVGGAKERERLAQAIDDLVAKMSIFARGIARDKLTETNPIAEKLSFAANEKVLTTRFDGRAFTAPLDGRPAKVTAISGDTMEMRYRIADLQIRQWIAGDEKGQINLFHLHDRRVTQHVRVYASQLPADLLYSLTYERT